MHEIDADERYSFAIHSSSLDVESRNLIALPNRRSTLWDIRGQQVGGNSLVLGYGACSRVGGVGWIMCYESSSYFLVDRGGHLDWRAMIEWNLCGMFVEHCVYIDVGEGILANLTVVS